jgi:hypothetical protein
MIFGILREFLLVGLLGFTAQNDLLQLYLSIFYTIGLTIDAMRLSCLNLYSLLTLSRIIFCASLIGLPFATAIGLIMACTTIGLNLSLLSIAILGSYLNLIVAVLVTYKQRNNHFLTAQIINVLPNFVLIPGIVLCYWISKENLVFTVVALTSLIPCIQCVLLFSLPSQSIDQAKKNTISFHASLMTFARHFSAMLGEQLFQIITRAAFFNYGSGYLSVFAITIRCYSAFRFILIDSYIGSKLFGWKKETQQSDRYILEAINSTSFGFIIALFTLFISIKISSTLTHSLIQIIIILLFGFYFSTLVRIIYFKINRHENNSALVWRFASYELIFAGLAFLLTKQLNYPLLALLWIGYVAKPFGQLLLLRKRFLNLAIN